MNRLVLAALAALLLPLAAAAADAGQLVDVVATGHGSTVREATKAALRAAVEQVVGTIVDATTLVENDELVEDEILRYSVGMVESAKQIGEPKKSADGFYTVKVKATVKKGQVEEKLRTASAVNVTLDGADLFARMTAAQDNLADAEAMIKDVLAKHVACVVAEAVPGENGTSPLDLDPKTGEVFANVRVRIDQAKYKQFANEVVDKLGPMAEKTMDIKGTDRKGNFYQGGTEAYFHFPESIRFGLLVLPSRRSGAAKAFSFDKNRQAAILAVMDTGSLAVSVRLSDRDGSELSFRAVPLDRRDGEHFTNFVSLFAHFSDRRTGSSLGCIFPFFGGDATWSQDEIGVVSVGFRTEYGGPILSEKNFRISLGTFVPDELKTFGDLKVGIGHMKDRKFVE